MLENNDFCVYGGIEGEEYGVQENPSYNFQVSYPVISDVHGGTTYFYYPNVVYIPVLYYVPVYYTSQVPILFEDPCVTEDNWNGSPGIGYIYDLSDKPEEYGPFNDVYNSFEETLTEGMTTVNLSYEEYSEKLSGASPDDEDESVISDKKLDRNTVLDVSDVNEGIASNPLEQHVYSVEEDVDEKVIKKISLLDIDEIKEEDDNYEDGKILLYNQVLKGYSENKNQLKELNWECHFLEDILEEEESVSEITEMDFNENFGEDLINDGLEDDSKKNDLPDVEKQSPSAPTSLPDELHVASSVVPIEANQPSKVSSEIGKNKSKDFSPNESEAIVDGGSMIRVGDVEIRYTPDRYRYFCLQESRKKRLKPIRKFFARIWRYVKKPT